jgi:hypothetical protein
MTARAGTRQNWQFRKRREALAFLRQAARATVRSENILPNGPWFVPSLMVAGFSVGGLGVVFVAGMAFG